MNKVKFIYNPYSGENSIVFNIDKIINIHQKKGYTIIPHRICRGTSIDRAFDDIEEDYKYILIAGGDGTVDSVVNCMQNKGIDLPIAIIPAGTANDFAKFIGIPTNIEKACSQILNTEVRKVDLGKINDKYFINVASMGLFTDISQKIDSNFKNTMGKLAYYIKGIEQLPNFRKLKVKVKSSKHYFHGDIYIMLIFNGQTAGNLNFAYKAQLDDGLLDVIIIKASNPVDMISLFINMLKGDHLDNNSIMYFKTDELEIESYDDIGTDIDGEKGPDFPLKITCIKHGLKILGIEE